MIINTQDTANDFRATPPSVSLMTTMHIPKMQTCVSTSGLTIHTYCKPDMPVIYMSAIIKGGAAEAMSPALCAMASTLRREGSHEYTGEKISEILDFNGASLRAGISSHHIQISLYSLLSRFNDVLNVFADLVCRPVFPEHEMEVRRESLARNIEISLENVGYLASVEGERQIMGSGHPLSIADEPASIRNITSDMLREFSEKFTTAPSVEIFICGNITPEITAAVTEAFDSRLTTIDIPALTLMPFNPQPAGTRHLSIKKEATQSSVVITLPAIPRSHTDYLPLHLCVFALGGYFGSRLMLNIREDKGLTYGINASMPGYIEDAYINITAETDNANVEEVIAEVGNELHRLSAAPCRDDELQRLKQSAFSSQAAVLDSPISITDHHITSLTQGLPENYFDAKQQAIATLSPQQISDIASRYLRPELMRIAIAGNPKTNATAGLGTSAV